MNSLRGFDFDRGKMRMLLERYRGGMLDLKGARELRPLLVQALNEATESGDKELESYLKGMIDILDMYTSGEINLYEPIDVPKVSNTD